MLLNIINNTINWTVAINATNLFTIPATASDSYGSLGYFFIFFIVVTFIIVSSSSLNTVLHLAIKELRTVPGMIIVGICGTAIIVFLCVTSTAVFQYLYRVNGNPAICAVFKYIITYFAIMYTILKVTYLFHFAYLMYRTYTLHSFEESKTLLYFYGVVIAVAGTICTSPVTPANNNITSRIPSKAIAEISVMDTRKLLGPVVLPQVQKRLVVE